jgi:CRISPR-associated protein Csd2
MSTGINAGQVRGPVQLTFAQSAEPIVPQEISITRMAATNEAEKKQRADGSEGGNDRVDNRTMGRKHIVPYGLYRAHGFISAKLAERTGFSEADLDLLREAFVTMFEHDRSAARGEMAMRKATAFRHTNALGNAPAHVLFERVSVGRNIDGEFRKIDRRLDNQPPAREFSDYLIEIDREGLPDGVEIMDWL